MSSFIQMLCKPLDRTSKPTMLLYTARQRKAETKQTKAEEHAAAFRGIARPVQGRSINEWESWFSTQPSRRTLDSAAFRAHIAAFYIYINATRGFWHEPFHREQLLDAYLRKQCSESHLISSFKAKFGLPRDVVVAFGDGARNQLSGRAPGPSTAIRRLLQRNHYPVIDVHEPTPQSAALHTSAQTPRTDPVAWTRPPDAMHGACGAAADAGRPGLGTSTRASTSIASPGSTSLG